MLPGAGSPAVRRPGRGPLPDPPTSAACRGRASAAATPARSRSSRASRSPPRWPVPGRAPAPRPAGSRACNCARPPSAPPARAAASAGCSRPSPSASRSAPRSSTASTAPPGSPSPSRSPRPAGARAGRCVQARAPPGPAPAAACASSSLQGQLRPPGRRRPELLPLHGPPAAQGPGARALPPGGQAAAPGHGARRPRRQGLPHRAVMGWARAGLLLVALLLGAGAAQAATIPVTTDRRPDRRRRAVLAARGGDRGPRQRALPGVPGWRRPGPTRSCSTRSPTRSRWPGAARAPTRPATSTRACRRCASPAGGRGSPRSTRPASTAPSRSPRMRAWRWRT